jgi:hypothetical protein
MAKHKYYAEYNKKYLKQWSTDKKAAGLCTTCGTEPAHKGLKCVECKERGRILRRRLRDSKEEIGLCTDCMHRKVELGKIRCTLCLHRSRIYQLRIKFQTFNAYGGPKCACCGETNPGFLTLDHIDGGGHQQVLKLFGSKSGSSKRLYKWLRDQKYPAGYQVLCFNCNCGRGTNNGKCPHHTPYKSDLLTPEAMSLLPDDIKSLFSWL